MARTPAPNGRRAGKETLAAVMALLAELTPSAMAPDVIPDSGAPRELLSAYATLSRPNLPPSDVMRSVADYVDARMVKLRSLTRRLRSQAAKASQEKRAPKPKGA